MGASPYRPVGYTPSEGASGFVLGEKSVLILFGMGFALGRRTHRPA